MAERPAGPRRVLAGLLVGAGLLLAGCGEAGSPQGVVSDVNVHDADGMHGAVLTSPYTLPRAALTDSRGAAFDTRAGLEAPLTLVFFGYTRCPDICQAVMADLASANARLDEGEADQVATWFVTTDPARDDPETLRAYLDRFDPDFEGLTGPLDTVVDLAAAVHVPVERGAKLPSGGYEVSHGTPVLGVRSDGSVPILWTEGTSAAKIAADIHTILAEGIPSTEEAR